MRGLVHGSVSVESLLAFTFGVVFVIVLLVFAVAIPNPTEFTIFIFRVVLALAAAGIGAVLPGLIDVKLPIVRAGGALALAVMVYLVNPPALIHDSAESKARSALQNAYAQINRGNMELAYDYLKEASELVKPEPLDIPFLWASSTNGKIGLT